MAATLPALLVTTVASTMSYALVFPTLAPLLKQLGGGSGGGGGGGGGDGGGASRWLGVAVAVFSATKILAAPPVGALTQSFGWRPTLLILMAVLVGANAWYALSTSIASVIAARGLIGIASCSSTCCRTAIVQHGGTKEQRARSTALLSAASTFGFIAGPASGGLLSLSPSIPWLRLRAPGWLGCALGGFTLLLVALSCPKKSEASDGMNDPLRSALAADSSGAQQGGGVESQSESSMSRTDSRTDSLHASRDGATARDTLDLTPPRTPERLPFPQSPDTGSGAGDRHAASPNPTPMWRLALTNSMAGRQQQSQQQQPREPRRSPTGFVVLCLVQLVATSPFASIETLITPFVSSAFGFNTLAIGLLFAGGSFTTLLVTALTPSLLKRLSPRGLLLLALIVMTLACAGMAVSVGNEYAFSSSLMGFFGAFALQQTALFCAFNEAYQKHPSFGQWMGWISSIASIGRLVGPLWATELYRLKPFAPWLDELFVYSNSTAAVRAAPVWGVNGVGTSLGAVAVLAAWRQLE